MRLRSRFARLGVLSFLIANADLRAQVVVPRRTRDDSAVVRATWLAYLATGRNSAPRGGDRHSPFWVEDEQRRWPVYDLAAFYLSSTAVASITIDVPKNDYSGASFRVITRYRRDTSTQGAPSAELTTTNYAIRVGDRWRFANALPIATRNWRRVKVGTITYVFAPSYQFDARRAHRAVAFADSVASAFRLPRLAPLTYYLTNSVNDVYAIMGLASSPPFNGIGGVSQPVNHQLFSGSAVLGEEYRHELVHFLFAPLCCDRTAYVVSEGVATWLGGTVGEDFRAAVRRFANRAGGIPAGSLDSLLEGRLPQSELYASAAVLVNMVFERSGVDGVRGLFGAGGSAGDLREYLRATFGDSTDRLDSRFRAELIRLGKP